MIITQLQLVRIIRMNPTPQDTSNTLGCEYPERRSTGLLRVFEAS